MARAPTADPWGSRPAQGRLDRALRPIAIAALLVAHGPGALAAELSEAGLKAAYLYNFVLYTEWPALPNTFEMCVTGADRLGDALDALARKEVAGRPIRVRRLGPAEVPVDCNVLFVATADGKTLDKLLTPLATRPVLTIADTAVDGNGRIILQLVPEQGRIGFSANLGLARAAGLTLGARMLRLARSVR